MFAKLENGAGINSFMHRFIFTSSSLAAFAFVALFPLPLQAEEAGHPPLQAELLRTVSGAKLGSNGFSAGQVKLERGTIYDVEEKKGFSDVILTFEGELINVKKSDVAIFEKYITKKAQILKETSARIIDSAGKPFSEVINLKKGMEYFVISKEGIPGVVIIYEGEPVLVKNSDANVEVLPKPLSTPNNEFPPGLLILKSAYYGKPTDKPKNSREVFRSLQSKIPKNDLIQPIEILVSDDLLGKFAGRQLIYGSTYSTTNEDGSVISTHVMQKPTKNILHIEYQYNGKLFKKSALEDSTLSLP